MKKILALLTLTLLLLGACHSPKPYYKTSSGKKKQKHYNKLQYGERKVFNQ
jgi:hypothetical protein